MINTFRKKRKKDQKFVRYFIAASNYKKNDKEDAKQRAKKLSTYLIIITAILCTISILGIIRELFA